MHGTGRALSTATLSGAVLASVLATTCLAASDTWPVTLTPGSNGESAAISLTVRGVTATCGGTDQVTVTWYPIPVPTSYRVWESFDTGSYVTVANGITTASTWTSTSLATGGTYRFEVSAGSVDSWTSAMSTPTTPVVIGGTPVTCSAG